MTSIGRLTRLGLALLAICCLGSSACAAPFASLDAILVDSRPALPGERGRVQVFRDGAPRDGRPHMAVLKGDRLLTTSDGVALVTLDAGYELILEPETDLVIENPSALLRLGRIIVKALQEVKEKLTVNTEFVSAGVEGTVFVYEVGRDGTVNIAVVEGSVTVQGPGWTPVTYRDGEAGTIPAARPPSRMERLDPATIGAIRARISEVEEISRPIVPDLRGQREGAGREMLEAQGLTVGRVTRVLTREGESETIVRTWPAAGTPSRQGEPVALEVADRGVLVPQVLGASLAEATRALRMAGLGEPDTTEVHAPNARSGTVVRVEPREGSLVHAGTRVAITIARATEVSDCTVPNLQDLTEEQARRTLIRAKLQAGRVQHLEMGTTVTQQSLEAGSRARCGTAVDFTVGFIG